MAKNKILVVDDEESLCEILQFNLEVEGYDVDVAYSAEQALEMHPERYSLILLDVMMGEMSGFRMTRILKERPETAHVPVIFCTAKDSEDDTVAGLNLGADDYITKPFSMRELLARVKANIRRNEMVAGAPAAAPSGSRMELGRISIDPDQMVVCKDGRPLDLTQREYELIKFLASQPGKVFSREALMEHVWNYEGYVGDVRAVDVAVRRLREKVEDDPASPQFVVTRRGLGYYFNA